MPKMIMPLTYSSLSWVVVSLFLSTVHAKNDYADRQEECAGTCFSRVQTVTEDEMKEALRFGRNTEPAPKVNWRDVVKEERYITPSEAFELLFSQEAPKKYHRWFVNSLDAKGAFELIKLGKIANVFLPNALKKLDSKTVRSLFESDKIPLHYADHALQQMDAEDIVVLIVTKKIPPCFPEAIKRLGSTEVRFLLVSGDIPGQNLKRVVSRLHSEDAMDLIVFFQKKLADQYLLELVRVLDSPEAYHLISNNVPFSADVKYAVIDRLCSLNAWTLLSGKKVHGTEIGRTIKRLTAWGAWRLLKTDAVPEVFRAQLKEQAGVWEQWLFWTW